MAPPLAWAKKSLSSVDAEMIKSVADKMEKMMLYLMVRRGTDDFVFIVLTPVKLEKKSN